LDAGLTVLEDRTHKTAFFSAPQSVTSLVAAFLEPTLTVLVFLLVTAAFGQPVLRSDLALCVLVIALTFPGHNRFKEKLINAGTEIITSWATLLAILWLCGYATNSLSFYSKDVLLTWALATPVLQWLAMAAGRTVLRRRASRPGLRFSALVVGAGPLGAKVARALQENREEGRDFVGWFDDRADGRVHADAAASMLGTLKDVGPYIRAHGVREVYITLPLGSQPRIVELLKSVQGTTASIFFVPDVFGISIIQGRLQDMNGVPVVGICETPFTGTNELVKRISDIVMASVILILVSPLLLTIALGVKLSSPGPVIFKQRRNGLDGGEIWVYKFRSMVTQDNGPVVAQATQNDVRVTPFGAFLRRTSLDELPQFYNVLQGRMSIVGPRPHAVAHNEMYRELIRAYMVRHKVKPGITGWAQINGLRGETETVEKMKARVEFDLEYLRNWSLGLDLQIIAHTVRVAFFERNAY
jgi:putative colanic acid biosysnthesis UDP-glucose lipid carrier transferase